ncbi:hypothetical protein QBC44DRAFT_311246 [Cladorrhinum sp. PSN332]|nr:hypothetical protein QBC44DRAFT_311246 [Cladorrhinum sp. PSN332]
MDDTATIFRRGYIRKTQTPSIGGHDVMRQSPIACFRHQEGHPKNSRLLWEHRLFTRFTTQSTCLLTQPLRQVKGTDASNLHDEEVPATGILQGALRPVRLLNITRKYDVSTADFRIPLALRTKKMRFSFICIISTNPPLVLLSGSVPTVAKDAGTDDVGDETGAGALHPCPILSLDCLSSIVPEPVTGESVNSADPFVSARTVRRGFGNRFNSGLVPGWVKSPPRPLNDRW